MGKIQNSNDWLFELHYSQEAGIKGTILFLRARHRGPCGGGHLGVLYKGGRSL